MDDIKGVKLNGKVKLNKDTESKKFLKLFFSGNLADAAKYAFINVIVPTAKDAICKTGTSALQYWVNGDKPTQNQGSGPNRVSWYWAGANNQKQSVTPVQRVTNNIYEVGSLYFDDRGDAETVLLKLKETLQTYTVARVADLYELSNMKVTYTDYEYGWRNLDSAYVGRVSGGVGDGKYVISLPKVTPLK